MFGMGELGPVLATLMFFWAMLKQIIPEEFLKDQFRRVSNRWNRYMDITFNEYQANGWKRNKGYMSIERYLGSRSSLSTAKRLKADLVKKCKSIIFSMDTYEQITDEYKGVKVWWTWSRNQPPATKTIVSFYSPTEKHYYRLTFHKKHLDLVTKDYLNYVLAEGKAIKLRNKQRKLYTNRMFDGESEWSDIVFDHPATFDSLAMDEPAKKEIIKDLITFSKSKEYYRKIGKAWKRGYLLYGPPGTGKSTLIAAMANLLEYDIYDLELTAVANNTVLRKLLTETTGKSVIVIEDIDCSLDLTGQRKKDEVDGQGKKTPIEKMADRKTGGGDSKITLSGLLNSIDGLWSACGNERVFVFTTNHIEKLDPALIRRGRMDKHIEMSYCRYDAFKVLAKNYLDVEYHKLFDTIKPLVEEVDMTPADVAEHLVVKDFEEDPETSLRNLIKALESLKELGCCNDKEQGGSRKTRRNKSQ